MTTFLKTREGKSMIGTKMPVDSPETRTTMSGKTYAGVTNREGLLRDLLRAGEAE